MAIKVADFIIHCVTFCFIRNLFVSTPLDKQLQKLEEQKNSVGIFTAAQWDEISGRYSPLKILKTEAGQIFKMVRPEDRSVIFNKAIEKDYTQLEEKYNELEKDYAELSEYASRLEAQNNTLCNQIQNSGIGLSESESDEKE